MRVVQTQWPVGQGSFHTGLIESGRAEPFAYVYDCGAHGPAPVLGRGTLLERCVEHATDARRLGLIAISHFDLDHVNGTALLLARTGGADLALVPYVLQEELLLVVLEAAARGRGDAVDDGALLAFVEDHIAWLRSRGIHQVVEVRPGSSGDLPPDSEPLEPPLDLPPRLWDETGKVARPVPTMRAQGQGGGRTTVHPNANAPQLQIGSGDPVQLLPARSTWLDWMFVPHTTPIAADVRDELLRQLRQLGLPAEPVRAAQQMLAMAGTDEGRRRLQRAYAALGGPHNRASMSLYAGPAYAGVEAWSGWASPGRGFEHQLRPWHDFACWPRFDAFTGRHVGKCGMSERICRCAACVFLPRLLQKPTLPAWLHTGDATLQRWEDRASWLRSYSWLSNCIGTLALPHHGSRHSWHDEILNMLPGRQRDACTAVASAGARGRYCHPHVEVLNDLADARIRVATVFEPGTALTLDQAAFMVEARKSQGR